MLLIDPSVYSGHTDPTIPEQGDPSIPVILTPPGRGGFSEDKIVKNGQWLLMPVKVFFFSFLTLLKF